MSQTLSMKPVNVPADGFYRVQLDGREFSVCVIQSLPRYIIDKSSSEPIPWEKFDRFEGVWWEGDVCPFQSMLPDGNDSPDFVGPAQMQIDLTPFCDTDGTRYAIDRPFIQRGWRYAVDGRIAIRMKTDDPDDVLQKGHGGRWVRMEKDEPRVPEMKDLGWKHAKIDDWESWPEAAYKDGDVPCEADGCDIDYDPSACPECGGKGTVVGPAYQPVGKVFVAVKYDRLIRQLPNVMWSPSQRGEKEADEGILFKFDGGEGIIMPIRLGDV